MATFGPAFDAARTAATLAPHRDGRATARAVLDKPPATAPEELYREHERILIAIIAVRNHEAHTLAAVHDRATWDTYASGFRELKSLHHQLNARRDAIPPLTYSDKWSMGLHYNGPLGSVVAHYKREARRVLALPGVGRALASALGSEVEPEPGAFPGPVPAPFRPGPRFAGGPPAGFPPAPSGPGFTVIVQNVPDQTAAEAISKRLHEIHRGLNASGGWQMLGQGAGRLHTYRITPMVNLDAFAARIDFGRARRTSGDGIQVVFTGLPPSAEPAAVEGDLELSPSNLPPSADPAGGYPATSLVAEPAIPADRPDAFSDVAPKGALLVGVRVSSVNAFGGSKIGSVQPVYRTEDSLSVGVRHGSADGPQLEAVAKPGYAVGAVRTYTALLVDGFELVFMKVVGQRLDATDAYRSPWLGDPRGGGPRDVDGRGCQAVGLVGRCGREVNELGLLFLAR
jgi:hypothetical protein